MFNKIKNLASRNTFILNLYHLSRPSMDMVYKVEDLDDNYYAKVKSFGDREMEHQIGRLTNFKKIVSEIESKNLEGDVIEFGTWKGFSLIWIAYFLERAGIFNKKIIGVDGFVGLPNSEGIFYKGAFKNTSQELCRSHIRFSKDLYQVTKDNISIEKYLYSEKDAILKRLREITHKKFSLIHIDCDISSSAKELFEIIQHGDLMAPTCYLCFDDYGCMESYKNTVDSLLKTLENKWLIKEHSETNLTKNFILQKR